MTSIYKFHIRLYGIDTPEMKSKSEENKERAIKARNRLIELCSNVATNFTTRKDIQKFFEENIYLTWITCFKMDKYGRTLANIYKLPNDTMSFSQILINENHGYEYFGKTKKIEN
jgi:endonuclease YncB( thermonuclease family)